METKVKIPFQQLLTIVRSLPPSQKTKLQKELHKKTARAEKDDFIKFLLKGPVYSEKEIRTIEENRKSISAWRTKSY